LVSSADNASWALDCLMRAIAFGWRHSEIIVREIFLQRNACPTPRIGDGMPRGFQLAS
jgi:hypothetical protein